MQRLQAAALLALVVSLPALAQQQDSNGNTCVWISGSSVCPQFQVYIGTDGLADDYPFLSGVTDVASFDKAAEKYFTTDYVNDVLKDKLGCTKATDSAVVQWERTVMCSTWASAPASQACLSTLQGATAVQSLPQICGATCAEYANSLTALGKNTTYCPASSNRASLIKQQETACYDISSSSNTKCVTGEQNEPGTCGFGSLAGGCAFCASSAGSSASCCSSLDCSSASSSTSGSSTDSSTSATSTSGGKDKATSGSKSKGISGGAIAGIVIGVIVGLILLGLLIFFLMRRRRSQNSDAHLLNTPTEKHRRSPTPSSLHNADNDVFASSPRNVEDAAPGTPIATAHSGNVLSANNAGGYDIPGSSNVQDGNVPPPIPFGAAAKKPGMGAGRTPDPWSSQPSTAVNSQSTTMGKPSSHTASKLAAAGAAGMAGVGAAKAMSSRTPTSAASNASDPFASPPAASPPAPVLAAAPTKLGPGATAEAIHPYTAALDDELTLEPGMKVLVRETFDDGWATGTVLSGGAPAQHGKLGKFPMVCVGGT